MDKNVVIIHRGLYGEYKEVFSNIDVTVVFLDDVQVENMPSNMTPTSLEAVLPQVIDSSKEGRKQSIIEGVMSVLNDPDLIDTIEVIRIEEEDDNEDK